VGVGAIRDILVFCTHGIGDVLLCVPAFRALRRAFPRARVEVLLRGPVQAEVLRGQGLGFAETHMRALRRRPGGLLRAVARWRRRGVDLALSTYNVNAWRAALLALAAGARRRVGFALPRQRVPFSRCLAPSGQHKVQENLRLVEAVAGPCLAEEPSWRVLPDERQWAQRRLAEAGLEGGRRLLALTPGCTPHEAHKRWPAELYAEALGWLDGPEGLDVLLLGGPGEEPLGEAVVRAAPAGVRVTDLIGQLTLRQTAAVMARCGLVLGGDCGLTHVAAALGVPCLVLVGPTRPELTAPRGPRVRVLVSPHSCLRCYGESMRIRRDCASPECMRALSPRRVAEEAGRMLRAAAGVAG